MALIALVVYVLFAFVQHGEVMLGLIDLAESNVLTAFNLCGAFAFYLLVAQRLSRAAVERTVADACRRWCSRW